MGLLETGSQLLPPVSTKNRKPMAHAIGFRGSYLTDRFVYMGDSAVQDGSGTFAGHANNRTASTSISSSRHGARRCVIRSGARTPRATLPSTACTRMGQQPSRATTVRTVKSASGRTSSRLRWINRVSLSGLVAGRSVLCRGRSSCMVHRGVELETLATETKRHPREAGVLRVRSDRRLISDGD